MDDTLPDALVEHLRSWVGAWPAQNPPLVVGNPRNDEPGWDGAVRPVLGVIDGEGRSVIGVPTALADRANAEPFADLKALERELPARLGMPDHRVFSGVFRWSDSPADLPDAGVWLPVGDERVPSWLHPFGGEVLVALEDDAYVAGVGVKRHDRWGHELAVVTDEAARGRGLARRLVAQAARRVVDEGAVATYLHARDNLGSARVAEASGFPDRGWSILGLFRPDDGPN